MNIENEIRKGKRFLFATFPEAARQGIFLVRLVASFLYGHILWELQERSDSMDRILSDWDAQRAGFLWRGLRVLAVDEFSGRSGANQKIVHFSNAHFRMQP